MKNEYIELVKRQQEEINALPLGFAYGDEQFKQMMGEWGLTVNDTDKIVRVAGGAFVQKKDLDLYHEVVNRHHEELEAAIVADKTGDGFIYQMFLTELQNHEYSYTGDSEETLDALGYTIDDIYGNIRLLHGFKKATMHIAAED